MITAKTIKNHVIKAVQPLTSRMYRDDAWQGVWELCAYIEKLGFDVSVSVKDGGYRKNDLSQWKEYELEISLGEIVVPARLWASAAGTEDDPFGMYDLSMTF
jgi:hypothetical protein